MLGNSQQSSLFRHGAKSNFGGLGSLGAGASSAMDALKRQADKLVEEQQAADEAAKSLTKKLADSQSYCHNLQGQLQRAQQDNARMRCAYEDGVAHIRAVEQKQSGFKALFECHRDSVGTLAKKAQQAEDFRAELLVKFNDRSQQLQVLEKSMQDLSDHHHMANEELQARKLKLQEAAEHIGSMQAAAAAADEGRQLLLNELQDFKLQQDTLTATLVEIRKHASSQALELATSQAEVTSLRGETTSLQRDLQDRSTELQETHCLLSSVTDERFQLESKLTTLQDTSATAIAAANAVQMDLTARVNNTMARVDELETELHSEQSQVANLRDSLTQSAERSKVVLAEKDECVLKLQTTMNEQQHTLNSLIQELEAAQTSANELAATSQQERDTLSANLAACTAQVEHLEAELARSRAAEESIRSESLAALDAEKRNARRAAVESGQKMDNYKERLAKELQDREAESQQALKNAQDVAKAEVIMLASKQEELALTHQAQLTAAEEVIAYAKKQADEAAQSASEAVASAAAENEALQARLNTASNELCTAKEAAVEEIIKLNAAHTVEINQVKESDQQEAARSLHDACSLLRAQFGAKLETGAKQLAALEDHIAGLQEDLDGGRRKTAAAAHAAAAELDAVRADLEDKSKLLAQISMAAHPGSTPRKTSPGKRPTDCHTNNIPVPKRTHTTSPPCYSNVAYQQMPTAHHGHGDADDESDRPNGNRQWNDTPAPPEFDAACYSDDQDKDNHQRHEQQSSKLQYAPIKPNQKRRPLQLVDGHSQQMMQHPVKPAMKAMKKRAPRGAKPTASGKSGRSTRFEAMAIAAGGMRQGKMSRQHKPSQRNRLGDHRSFKASNQDLEIFGGKMSAFQGLGDDDPFNFDAPSF